MSANLSRLSQTSSSLRGTVSKQTNSEYCNGDCLLNSLLTTLNKSLRTSPETNFRLIQLFDRSKNNFGDIHMSPGLDLASPSLSLSPIILSWRKGDVTRDDSQRRFSAQHSVTTLLRHCFESLQHCSNIATLFCDNSRRCKSSRVTSPY